MLKNTRSNSFKNSSILKKFVTEKLAEKKLREPSVSLKHSNMNDPFVARYYEAPRRPWVKKYGQIPSLKGNYKFWKSYIEDAVSHNAAPSEELIEANRMLAGWEAHLGIGRVSSFPVTIGFNMTDICNARCSFCAYSPERVSETMLTIEQAKNAKWLKFCKLLRPNGGGLGEPLAHPQIVDLLEIFRANAPFLNMGTITNGSLMRPRVIELVSGYFKYFYVSINAACKETYEQTMPPLKWEKLLSNLAALRDEKILQATSLPILQAGYVVHKHNLDELPELPSLLNEFGFKKLNVKPMMPPPHCSISDQLYKLKDSIFTVPERADKIFRHLEHECKIHNIELMYPLPSLKILKTYKIGDNIENMLDGLDFSNTKETLEMAIDPFPTNEHSEIDPEITYDAAHKIRKRIKAGVSRRIKRLKNKVLDLAGISHDVNLHCCKTKPSLVSIVPQNLQSRNLPLGESSPKDDPDRLAERWAFFMTPSKNSYCTAAWDRLNIDAFSRTKICCSYFERMPTFNWPTMEEFHSEHGMWNHPFMQHLRSTMGRDEEVPFCSLCQGRYDRNRPIAKVKSEVILESQKILQDIYDENVDFQFKGKLSELKNEELPNWETNYSKRTEVVLTPFKNERHIYRRMIRMKGFWDLGQVLQIGSGQGAITPFLAEANDKVFLLDKEPSHLMRASDIYTALSIKNCVNLQVNNVNKLELEDAQLNGIWTDSEWIWQNGNELVLSEMRRVLQEKGRLHCSNAPSIGRIVERIVDCENVEDINSLIEVLEEGSLHNGKFIYFSMTNLLPTLRSLGFNTDRSRPPQSKFIGGKSVERGWLGNNIKEIVQKLKAPNTIDQIKNDHSLLNGLEHSISFEAIAEKKSPQNGIFAANPK